MKLFALKALLLALLALSLPGCSPSSPKTEIVGGKFVFDIATAAFEIDSHVVDNQYFLVDPVWVATELSPVAIRAELGGQRGGKFTAEITDCDDFSRAAAHLAFKQYRKDCAIGPAYGQVAAFDLSTFGRHAFNWFLGTDGRIWFHEPQTGQVWTPNEVELVLVFWWIL
jgi:hypothetical protein